MENFFIRYRNQLLLGALMFMQVVALATQVKHSDAESGAGTRLIRYWAIASVTPVEKVVVHTGQGIRDFWHGYLNLRGVREQNRDLLAQLDTLRMEQASLSEEAAQGRRLQALLDFKKSSISQTVAAQVIGSSGNDQSRVILIDKGRDQGIRDDQAVISPEGIVGKVFRVFPSTAQVLVINDPTSGVGAILEASRLQGIVNGTAEGSTELHYIMADEKVTAGERVLTSGGDRIFPKGLPIGTVEKFWVDKNRDNFLAIRLRPAVSLNRLEEVLVVTQVVEAEPNPADAGSENPKGGMVGPSDGATGLAAAKTESKAGDAVPLGIPAKPSQPLRAIDILAQRLPGIPPAGAAPESNDNKKAVAATAAKPLNAKGKPVTAHKLAPSQLGHHVGASPKKAVAKGNLAPTGDTTVTSPQAPGSVPPKSLADPPPPQ